MDERQIREEQIEGERIDSKPEIETEVVAQTQEAAARFDKGSAGKKSEQAAALQEPMVRGYPRFALLTLGYAFFYTLCLYQNGNGITFPIFTAGTIMYFYWCFQWLGIAFKKKSFWYLAAIELLGISTFLTGDQRIITLNKIGIFLLVICFLLHTVYEDKQWDFSKYTGAFFTTIFMSLFYIGKPVSDGIAYRRLQDVQQGDKKNGQIKYIMLGLAICMPLVLIVLLLLAGADAVFADFFVQMFSADSEISMIQNTIKIVLLTGAVFFVAYMLVAYLSHREIKEEVGNRVCYEPAVAITVALVLSVIYVLFCWIQIRYLFVGGALGQLTLPKGMSYSQYARSGFFQLLFVCILNLVIVLLGMYRFRESKLLKALLCVITGCTYIMTASSALRMILYIQYKYLTFLRIFVLWSLAVIALLFVGVLLSIIKKEFPLFRYSVVVVTCSYLLLSFARPDYWIAKVNTENMEKGNQYEFFRHTPVYDDVEFLAKELGSDAAPVIMKEEALKAYENWDEEDYLERSGEFNWFYARSYEYYDYGEEEKQKKEYFKENWRSIYIYRMDGLTKDMGIRDFNLSGYLAKVK